jgi:hypothetical protein
MINGTQQGSKKVNKVRESIKDLNKKVSNMDEIFRKEIEILKKEAKEEKGKKEEMLEMKN